MKKGKQFKRLWGLMLLLIAMLMPQGAWAANHYDAGYESTATTYSAAGIKFKITAVRMYNYQGNNSHFNSNPVVTITAGGHTHTFNLGSLTGESGNSIFYYNGEGNENPYKGSGSFSKRTYEQTVDGIPVKAYFDNQKNEQRVSTNPDKTYKDNGDGSSKWCTADLTIEIGVQTAATVTINGNWRDESDGINKTESYSWPFDIPKHTCNSDIQSATSTYLKSAATCTAAAVYYKSCSFCGTAQSGTFTSGSALGHGSTGYTESYSWTGNAYNNASQDTKACTFTLTCKKCSTKVVNGASLTCTKTAHVDASCTATGSTTYQATGTYTAANSDYNYSATKTNVYTVAALGHGTTGFTESYSWTGNAYNNPSQDTKACTFTLTCKKCSTKVVNGASLTCTMTSHVNATCTATGSTTYRATGSYTAANSDYNYSSTNTNVYTVAALGHGSTGYTDSYSWTGNAYNDASQDTKACIFTLTCKKCSTKVVNGASLTCTMWSHVDATCRATGSTTYQATGSYTAANSAYNYSATKTNVYTVAALGHGSTGYTPTYTWGGTYDDATCTFTLQCGRCDGVVFNDNITTSKVDANHKDATCTEPGNERWTATGSYSKTGDATYNGTAQTKDYTIPTSHHTFTNKTLTDDPVEDGLYAYVCDNGCGEQSDAHVIKDYDGAGNNLELTKDGEGNYTAYSVDIVDGKSFFTPVPFTSKIVTMNRTFISSSSLDAAVPATIMLPFSTDGSDLFFTDPYGNLIDGALFYKFNSITRNAETGKWEAIMTHVKDVIQAYTPYIFVGLAQDHLEFGWNFYTMTFPATPAASDMITTDAETGWTFVGLNETKRWEEGDQEIGKAYGLAGKDKDYDDYSVHRGDFVKIAAGASAKPGRCYLLKEGSLVSKAKGMTRAGAEEELPAVIQLRLIGNEDGVTGIAELNTETGEMSAVQWYDLNGRNIEKPTKGGIYIKNNKKVLVK